MALSIPLERIEEQARTADPRRALLTAVLLLPFALGWTARRAWMALVYLWSAIVAGWQDAARPRAAEDGSEKLMGLLERVAEAHRGRAQAARGSDAKGWSTPDFWDLDRLRFPFLGSSSLASDREQIENDFEGCVTGIAKRNGPIFALMMVRMLVF